MERPKFHFQLSIEKKSHQCQKLCHLALQLEGRKERNEANYAIDNVDSRSPLREERTQNVRFFNK